MSGACSGSGKALTCLLARVGANVAICGRNEEKLAAAVLFLESIGARVSSQPMTIRDPEQVDRFIEAVWENFGSLDILVNNAGGQFPQPALDFVRYSGRNLYRKAGKAPNEIRMCAHGCAHDFYLSLGPNLQDFFPQHT